jgi:hypothetical protein
MRVALGASGSEPGSLIPPEGSTSSSKETKSSRLISSKSSLGTSLSSPRTVALLGFSSEVELSDYQILSGSVGGFFQTPGRSECHILV